jgi:hypothetical protein
MSPSSRRHDLAERRHGHRLGARVVAVLRGETAADVEAGQGHAGAAAHPFGRGERTVVDVRVLDLRAHMEAQTGAKADAVDALQQLDGVTGSGAEFPGQLVGRVALGLQAGEQGDRRRVDLQGTHDAQDLNDLILMIERKRADVVCFEGQRMSDWALTGCM